MIGSGSWATAMVKMLGDNLVDKDIYWWVRDAEKAEHIRKYKHNPRYLSAVDIEIPEENILTDIRDVLKKSSLIILNTPAAFLKDALNEVPDDLLLGKTIVSAIKGIVPQEDMIVGDYLQHRYGIPLEKIAVIGGPCHAEEVSAEKLSYLTIAADSVDEANQVAALLETRYIKTLISDDVYGIEYAAVLKNIYAVACGICHGVGFGDNFQAVLISAAIREMSDFLHRVHPGDRDIKQSAYLGDLLVTAYSQFSRNRTFGNMIGKGYSVRSAQLEMNMVAEGYYASGCIQGICAKYQLTLPICDAVYQILYANANAGVTMKKMAENLA